MFKELKAVEKKIDAAGLLVSANNLYNDKKEKIMDTQNKDFTEMVNGLIIPNKPKEVEVEDVVTDVPFSKPKPRQYFQTRPGELFAQNDSFAFIEDSDFNRTIYIVSPDIYKKVESECYLANLVACITRQGSIFLWPLKIDKKQKENSWNSSAREAALLAECNWVVKKPTQSGANCYAFQKSLGKLSGPEWPDMDFNNLLQLAMKNYLITNVDHPVIKSIQGYI